MYEDSRWRVEVNAEVLTPTPTGALAQDIASRFGVDRVLSRPIGGGAVALDAGEIGVILGPSGSGKSVVLSAVRAAIPQAVGLLSVSPDEQRLPAEWLGCETVREALGLLSRCGLADATALLTPAGRLSEGEKFRLSLARGLAECGTARRLLVVDEFASALDSVTAAVLSRRLRRMISRRGLGLLIVTHRAELLSALQPDRLWVVTAAGQLQSAPSYDAVRLADPSKWPVVQGRLRDFRPLERFHYVAGPPALHKRVYIVRTPERYQSLGAPDVAAALIISPPLGCVRGRNIATAGRYSIPARRTGLAKLNVDFEAISRVVVHPMFRSCGLAVRLIRHAIATSPVACVESLAAMGKLHPMFTRAGMADVGLFRGPRHYYRYYITPQISPSALPGIPVHKETRV